MSAKSQIKEIPITAQDGVTLKGLLIEQDQASAVTVLHGATGVPYRYYSAFAQWYSQQTNRNILFYEYRDSGRLTKQEVKASKVTMADWGVLDQSAALDFAINTYPDLPVHTIGHSLGGFCVPFHENAHKIETHTTVNSGLAYWKEHPWSYTAQVIAFWFILGPLATLILGYLPGVLLGMKTNLPPKVYWQWRRWCTNPNLHEIDWGKALPEPDLNRFIGKLTIIAAKDDQIIPPHRVFILDRFFPKATVEKRMIDPKDYHLQSLGHIAIFAEHNKAVWPEIIRG